MIKIGVFGAKQAIFTRDIINSFLSITSLKVKKIDIENLEDNTDIIYKDIDILLVLINKGKLNKEEIFNILIINDDNNFTWMDNLIKKQTQNDFLLINADNKKIYKYLQNRKGNLITCGFNSKACITTSSVIEDDYKIIQVCIQRSFKTLNKKTIDQQEFSVNIESTDNNVFNLLSAVTTVLLCDIKIDTIS